MIRPDGPDRSADHHDSAAALLLGGLRHNMIPTNPITTQPDSMKRSPRPRKGSSVDKASLRGEGQVLHRNGLGRKASQVRRTEETRLETLTESS
jgi:hypothetical protein